MQRLKASRTGFLTNRQKELDAIHATFVSDSYTNDAPLSGEFLLGFHSQRLALRNKTSDEPETSSNNGE
jgi:CRISPR-associated protein Csd1